MEQSAKKDIRNISLKLVIAVLLFFISLAVFTLLAHQVAIRDKDWFDDEAFDLFQEYATPGILNFFKSLTFFGSPMFLVPAYLLLIAWLIFKKRNAAAIDVAIIGITSKLLLEGLKRGIGRERPPLPFFEELTNPSFPSGHALSSFIFCSVLIWLLWKNQWQLKWKLLLSVFLLFISFSIGISRIVLRYHYASDVVAGFCMGFVWVMLSLWVQQKLRKNNSSTAKEKL